MQKRIQQQGKTLEYEVRGSGKPVMLVHGFTEDRKIWDLLLSGLSEKYYWILPDLPGSGGSEYNAATPTLADLAESLKRILDEEKLDAVLMIGHSMGGYISLAFAEKYPEKLLGLGLFHSSSYADSDEKKESRDKNIRFIQKNGSAAFIEQSLPGLYSEGFKAENPGEISKQIERYANFNAESLVQYLTAMKQRPATTGVLESLTKPILFIMGKEDKAVPIDSALEQSHIPRIAHIHILNHSAHMGMIEETELCKSYVNQFIEQVPLK